MTIITIEISRVENYGHGGDDDYDVDEMLMLIISMLSMKTTMEAGVAPECTT